MIIARFLVPILILILVLWVFVDLFIPLLFNIDKFQVLNFIRGKKKKRFKPRKNK
jgi:uncharacterized protein HemY